MGSITKGTYGIDPMVSLGHIWDKSHSLIFSTYWTIVVSIFMYTYQHQYAWVKWGQSVSSRFQIRNGTRQGSMASPALWSVYLDLLIKELRNLGVGCHVGGLYMGVVVYADDVLLMAPTRGAM